MYLQFRFEQTPFVDVALEGDADEHIASSDFIAPHTSSIVT